MSDKRYPSEAADRFQVRMPPGMRAAIAEEAKRNNRSANAQIVWMLEQMMPRDRATKAA